MDIPINSVGRVAEGPDAGLCVKVLDDTSAETGGYYVLTWQEVDGPEKGHDDWVEAQGLAGYFAEAGWRVSWSEDQTQ